LNYDRHVVTASSVTRHGLICHPSRGYFGLGSCSPWSGGSASS